ncbi:MAG: hypothetical protein ABIN74_03410 [Ferruginibacter sp.]
MKIEQLLVQHFYNTGEITLQGMGTFTLSPDFVAPKEMDKDIEIPANAISFQYNPRATADEALIDYIVQQTRKMKALATADLDSYLVLGKQFLHIGKPFKIEGMGMLVKNQQGDLDFTKAHSFHSKSETTPVAIKEQRENPEISFASESKPTPGNKKGLLVAAIILGFGLIGTTAWYFLIKKNNTETVAVTPDTLTDTVNTVVITKPDSVTVNKADSTRMNDGYNFKVVFMETPDSAVAAARMNELNRRGHTVIMYKNGSLNYKLAEPFKLPLSDTAHIKDSLNSFYYLGKGFIEL